MSAQPSTVWLARLVPEDRPAWTSACGVVAPLNRPLKRTSILLPVDVIQKQHTTTAACIELNNSLIH